MNSLFSVVAIMAALSITQVFRSVRRHRSQVLAQIALSGQERAQASHHTVVLPVPSLPNRVVLEAVEYAKSISQDVIAVHVKTEDQEREVLLATWTKFVDDVPLIVLESSNMSVVRPVLRFVDEIVDLRCDHKVTVVLPEVVPEHWWQNLLHNQTSLLLKQALLYRPKIIVTSVPYHVRGMRRRHNHRHLL